MKWFPRHDILSRRSQRSNQLLLTRVRDEQDVSPSRILATAARHHIEELRMNDPKEEMTRRDVLKCSAAGTAITFGAMVRGNETVNGAEPKGTEKMSYYKADGSFDADAAKQAYFDMFKALGFPVPDSLRTDEFWVCDFLQGDFEKLGMGGVFWVNTNGTYGQSGSKSYQGKFKDEQFGYLGHDLFLLPGQMLPEHHHIGGPEEYPTYGPKMEAWLVRHGSVEFFGEFEGSEEKPISQMSEHERPWGYGSDWFRSKFVASRSANEGRVYTMADPESWHCQRAGKDGAIVTEFATFHNHVSFSKPDMEFDSTKAAV